MRRPGRTAPVVLMAAAVLASLLALTATPAAATAEPTGACTTTSGVILAVDFGHWGGPILRSCGTTPTTGYTLLNQGGWHTTGTSHDGPGFICRIGYSGYAGGAQYPTSADEQCVVTPPASAYWSYWRAGPGQNSWSYSQLGPMSDHPSPGSVELWTFGATNVGGTQGAPTISPAAVRARNITPSPSARPSSHPSSASPTVRPTTSHSSTAGTGLATAPTASTASTVSTVSTASTASTASTGSSSAAATPSGGVVDAEPVAHPSGTSSGSPLPLVGGLGLVVLLGGAGGLARWRRRSDVS